KGMLAPKYQEVVYGHAEVREIYKSSAIGTICGSYVQDGKMLRNSQARVVRDGIVVHEGDIASLRRFKDDVREVATNYECGIALEKFNDIKLGDIIECFAMEEIPHV
ncbi:MAG: translation initiation factor IF-2, partial [Oscillospiraceae bacterium]|nr:translation initiation factor IF-2 [Oscillospiraceae bacterium]